MDLGVRGKGYLVVGGTAGMGFEAARVLLEDGASVVVTGRDVGRAESAVARLAPFAQDGAGVHAVVGDVAASQSDADRIVGDAVAALGGLAGLAVTAGSNRSAHSTLEDATDDIWEESFQEQLMGTVRAVRAAIPRLVAGGGGTVVTTAAYSIHSPHHNRMPYVSMKSAVAAFTKNVAKSYGAQGVRANCICPGAVETEGLAAMRHQLAQARGVPAEGLLERVMKEEWHMDVALSRPGRPSELGEVFAFLLSNRGAYLTGALINVDGGTDF